MVLGGLPSFPLHASYDRSKADAEFALVVQHRRVIDIEAECDIDDVVADADRIEECREALGIIT